MNLPNLCRVKIFNHAIGSYLQKEGWKEWEMRKRILRCISFVRIAINLAISWSHLRKFGELIKD